MFLFLCDDGKSEHPTRLVAVLIAISNIVTPSDSPRGSFSIGHIWSRCRSDAGPFQVWYSLRLHGPDVEPVSVCLDSQS